MTTALKSYEHLLRDVQPRPIRSKAAYRRALAQVEKLMRRPHLSRAESEIVELLSLLIEQYEAIELATPECSPAELLEHLLEARRLSKAELARQTAIPRSVITNVLAGRRGLSKANAVKLANYFGVSLSLFIEAR
jgi:HTH-type transcriptional regulator / antitoxin HigA